MTRFLSLLALVLAAPLASPTSRVAAQTFVVTKTDRGVQIAEATSEPLGADPSALVVHSGTGAWSLRALSPGDVPTVEAERMARAFRQARERRVERPARPAAVSELIDAPALRARYSVRSTVAPEAVDALLVELAGFDAVTALDATTRGEHVLVEVTFQFGSVAEWAAWKAASATAAALAPLMTDDAQTSLEAR